MFSSDELEKAIAEGRDRRATDILDPKNKIPVEELHRRALEYVFANLAHMHDDFLAQIYNRAMSEILRRNLEIEITGKSDVQMSQVSLDKEFSGLLRLAKQMQHNLNAQMLTEAGASNKEIRDTLKACADTVKTLVSHQESIFTLGRMATLEAVLLECLGEISPELRDQFLKDFRTRLEEASS